MLTWREVGLGWVEPVSPPRMLSGLCHLLSWLSSCFLGCCSSATCLSISSPAWPLDGGILPEALPSLNPLLGVLTWVFHLRAPVTTLTAAISGPCLQPTCTCKASSHGLYTGKPKPGPLPTPAPISVLYPPVPPPPVLFPKPITGTELICNQGQPLPPSFWPLC